LGEGYEEKYGVSINEIPIAAASLGQVHKGIIKKGGLLD
jgi:predicted unusual protein kinase regulating ubiquinone biosynthesis (AarF/ABC1/UbiB family)